MNLFLVFSFVLLAILGVNGQKCTDALLRKTDNCVKKILYIGDDNIRIIRTDEDYSEHCKEIKASHDCFRRYGKCLRLFPKQIFTLFLRSSKQIIKDRCSTEKGKREFMKHAQCVRKPEIYEENKCLHKGVIALNYVAVNTSKELIIPQMCCALHDLIHCLKVKGDEYCTSVTGPDTGNYVAGVGRQFVQDIVDLSCGNRKTVEECQKEEPTFMKYLDSLAKPFSAIKPQSSGVIVPMVKVTKKLDS